MWDNFNCIILLNVQLGNFTRGCVYNLCMSKFFILLLPPPCRFWHAMTREVREQPIVIDPMLWSFRGGGRQRFTYRTCLYFVVDFIWRKLKHIRIRNVSKLSHGGKYIYVIWSGWYVFKFVDFVATSWTSLWGYSKWRLSFSSRPSYQYQGQHDLFVVSSRVYSPISDKPKVNGKYSCL